MKSTIMYTKEKIGIELKNKINEKLDCADISKWALDVYLTDIAVSNVELDAVLSKLIMINEGSEFELSYKELTEIADMLIAGDKYTQQKFGQELKAKIYQKIDVANIGNWVYSKYSEHMFEIDDDFRDLLIDLGGMSAGPEFELSYEKLDKIADQLIVGEDIKFNERINLYVQQPVHKIIKGPYTRIDFAAELKNKVRKKENLADITEWFYTIYSQYYHFIYLPHRHNKRDKKFRNLLMELYVINKNAKFKHSYEQLDNIASKLIAGEDVKLDL